jgi:RIO-like serine/threonine protein kinase
LIQTATQRYRLSDIEEATNGFERQIGSGGSGNVYYGKLPDGREIAAKILKNHEQSVGDFTNEVCFSEFIRFSSIYTVYIFRSTN